jgi:hypothetical protein
MDVVVAVDKRDAGSALSWRGAAAFVARVGVVALFLAAGMGLLTFLKWTQRVSANHLQADLPAVVQGIRVAAWCVPISAIAALQTESCLGLLGFGRWRFGVCQLVFSSVWAAFGGALAFVFFREAETGPKETMLFAGGALLFFLGTALHLSLWRLCGVASAAAVSLPAAWYWILLVLTTTFFGGFWGWRGVAPQARRVLEYRQRWPHDERPLPPPQESPPRIVLQPAAGKLLA